MRLAVLFCLLVASAAQAEIYKSYDANGNVIFSDVPNGVAEKIEEKQIMTVPALPAALKQPKKNNTKQDLMPNHYKITINGLAAQSTVQKQAPTFNVGVSFAPALYKTHTLDILLDGRSLGKNLFSTPIDPSQLERGQHRLEAKIFNEQQKEIQSEVIDFFVQQPTAAKK